MVEEREETAIRGGFTGVIIAGRVLLTLTQECVPRPPPKSLIRSLQGNFQGGLKSLAAKGPPSSTVSDSQRSTGSAHGLERSEMVQEKELGLAPGP